VSVYTIETIQTIFHVEAEIMPCYTLGERQVAGIKFEWGHYYEKVINSVEPSERQRNCVEILTQE
jgi:hypothetical protein